jgi:threonine synthase
MKYISTRGQAPVLTFEEAMLTGLARDGGLYVPEALPQMSPADIAALAGLSYEDAAFSILWPFVQGDFSVDELKSAIAKAYAGFGHAARAPLKQIGANHFLLELFHGPTLAFKDFAMQLIGQLFQTALARSGKRITIVGATSGDTGSAAIEAFKGLSNVDVFILYPHGRVSDVQRRQMTTPSEANVHALALDGTFDDCQNRLKDMFNDHAFRDVVALAGVNSINFARCLAQVVYYFTAAVSLGAPNRKVSFTVPTGNFGDIYAGHIARGVGLPIEDLVIATNQNDILHRTLTSGDHRLGEVRPSFSPSMDIQISSNFERALFDLLGRDAAAVRALMADLKKGGYALPQGLKTALNVAFKSGRTSEEETLATIRSTLADAGEVICPHTAVGVHVAKHHLSATPMVTLATAHPAKFPDAVKQACGISPALPARLAEKLAGPERVTRVANDLASLQTLVREQRR